MTVTDTAPADVLDQLAADAKKEQADAAAKVAAGDAKPKAAPKGKGGSRAGAGRPKGARTTTGDAAKLKELDKRLAELFTVAGMGVMTFNAVDGLAIVDGAEPLAIALGQLARENATVKRVLFGLLETSAWGAVAMAIMPIALKIAANHNALPAGPLTNMFGGGDDPNATPGNGTPPGFVA